jgi:DNA-binding LacI/PurR family transcriptional regulator
MDMLGLLLLEIGFPTGLLHQLPPDGLDIPCVTFENRAGSRKPVEHLVGAAPDRAGDPPLVRL